MQYIIKADSNNRYGSTYYNRDSEDAAALLASELLQSHQADEVVLFRAVQRLERQLPSISTTDL